MGYSAPETASYTTTCSGWSWGEERVIGELSLGAGALLRLLLASDGEQQLIIPHKQICGRSCARARRPQPRPG